MAGSGVAGVMDLADWLDREAGLAALQGACSEVRGTTSVSEACYDVYVSARSQLQPHKEPPCLL